MSRSRGTDAGCASSQQREAGDREPRCRGCIVGSDAGDLGVSVRGHLTELGADAHDLGAVLVPLVLDGLEPDAQPKRYVVEGEGEDLVGVMRSRVPVTAGGTTCAHIAGYARAFGGVGPRRSVRLMDHGQGRPCFRKIL